MLSVTFLIPTRACSSCFHRANGDGGIIKAMHITFTWTLRGCGILNGKSLYMSQPIHVPFCTNQIYPDKFQIYIHKPPFSHGFPIIFPWFSHGFPKRLPVPRSIDPAEAVEGRRAGRHPQVGLRRRGVQLKSHGKTMGKSWKTMENPGKTMGKPWENPGKTMGKPWNVQVKSKL